jgi:hypothetical protein
MLIDCFREKLLVESCCDRVKGGLIEIPNSIREKELKKVWVDCSAADDALLIRLEEKKNSQLCPLFRRTGSHLKTCDGILLLAKEDRFHAIFCELKTSWNAEAIKQIRNSHLFFNYAHAVAKEWHGASPEAVSTWFAVITTGVLPIVKYGTRFSGSAIPTTNKPSGNVLEPRRLRLAGGKGQSAKNPLLVRELANL